MQGLSEPKLKEIFRAVLHLPAGSDPSGATQEAEPAWDSLAHALLVSAIESEFGIEIDVADSLELTSYESVTLYLGDRGL